MGGGTPTLLTLQDGGVLAVSGLDQTSQLNVLPETYDGVGWSHTPAVTVELAAVLPPVPPGGRTGVLQRRTIRRQQRGTAEYLGSDDEYRHRRGGVLVEASKRNQAASVLLPPAQDQRVMMMGGGPSDMHDETVLPTPQPSPTCPSPSPRWPQRRLWRCGECTCAPRCCQTGPYWSTAAP